MKIDDTYALIVVDVQNDFCPGGALPVDSGDRVVGAFNAIFRKFDYVYCTRDWHPWDHISFSEEPKYCDGSWPVHCMQDSPGALFHGELYVPLDAKIINKGDDPEVEAYSGFENPELHASLQQRGIQQLIIGGLTTDYCVKATVLDAIKHGYTTWILLDGCKGIAPETTDAAMDEMKAAGAHTINSGQFE